MLHTDRWPSQQSRKRRTRPLAGEVTPESLAVEADPRVHSPPLEVHPIELDLGEWNGDKGASGHQLSARLGPARC